MVKGEGATSNIQIAVPGGELIDSVFAAVRTAGMGERVKGDRQMVFPIDRLGVDLVTVRASSIPKYVRRPDSNLRAGLTGYDILWDAGLAGEGETVPTINNQSSLIVGMTESHYLDVDMQEDRSPTRGDLAYRTVVTKFPNIARDVFSGIPGVNVEEMPGSTESAQYYLPDAVGLLDVTMSGATIQANGIRIIDTILDPVEVQIIKQHELDPKEERVIADFTALLSQREFARIGSE